MDTYTIIKCRLCGKTFIRYPHQVATGDSSCCGECNERARRNTYGKGHCREGLTPETEVSKRKFWRGDGWREKGSILQGDEE